MSTEPTQLKRLGFAVVIAAFLAILAAIIAADARNVPIQNYPVGYEHNGSLANYGFRGASSLRKANGIPDSRLCAGKTDIGPFTIKARAYYARGKYTTVTDRSFGNGANCKTTSHNHGGHRTGFDPWGGDHIFEWSAISRHGSRNP